MANQTALVCGAGGFIGGHLVKRLKTRRVLGSRRRSQVSRIQRIGSRRFRRRRPARSVSLAAMHSTVPSTRSTSWPPTWAAPAISSPASTTPTSCTTPPPSTSTSLEFGRQGATSRSSSIPPRPACIRPTTRKTPTTPTALKTTAYPAAPDSEYGWEKLFSERLYLAYHAQLRHGGARRPLPQHLRPRRHLARRHARRRPPRSAARSPKQPDGGEIEIWGDGKQTRSFLYIDECVEGVRRLMELRLLRAGQYRLGGDGHHQSDWPKWSWTSPARSSPSSTFPARSACAAATPTIAHPCRAWLGAHPAACGWLDQNL